MKPTASQLSVLRKLAQGYILTQSWGGRVSGSPVAWFSDYYDGTKRYGDKYVHMNTFQALRKREWIKQTEFKDGISTYTITESGRKAYETHSPTA